LRSLNPVRASFVALLILAAALPAFSGGVNTSVPPRDPSAPVSSIVIGFVGGFVDHNNPHHGPVQLAQRIRQTVPQGTYVQVFENRRRKAAYRTVVTLLDSNRDGVLTPDEKNRARVILFGHSWGASAAVLLARDLHRQGIPVLLTVQVDSVAKLWQNDSVIPDNVAEAVNFYQTDGIVHGRRQIVAADPAKTEILGNYRVDYRRDPIECPDAPWLGRVFIPGHLQSECDLRIWSKIENLVKQRLSPQTATAVVSDTTQPQPSR
jgi:hypothetical protein